MSSFFTEIGKWVFHERGHLKALNVAHHKIGESGEPSMYRINDELSDSVVRDRIFLLLDATQASLGGASGKFPQYYKAYYDLVSAGVQFPQRPRSSIENRGDTLLNGQLTASRHQEAVQVSEPQAAVPESSVIIQKASNALEVLKQVLDTVDPQNPEGARDEFTLDLVEQCSFQKQQIMQIVMTSRRNIVLLLSHRTRDASRPAPTANHIDHEDTDGEEEPEQLFRRFVC